MRLLSALWSPKALGGELKANGKIFVGVHVKEAGARTTKNDLEH